MKLDDLKIIDNLRELPFEKCECFLHENHRWVLPIINYAQERGILFKPCKLVMFDAHHDAIEPSCIDEIRRVRESGTGLKDLVCLCRDKLRHLNDDWVTAGMELGLIGDAVIFGVENTRNHTLPKSFVDHCNNRHRIELMGLPGKELKYQGSLSDLTKSTILSEVWRILEWQYTKDTGFKFARAASKILLDFDLDCFVIRWRDYLFPWPDEIFEREFFTPSDYFSTKGWTGKRFLDELVSRAALLTIAREPQCCGGDEKASQILRKVNGFLFDNNISI